MLKAPLVTDEQKARDYALLGGLNRAELAAVTEKLLADYWPVVRRLAQALVERKEISGRRARQILFRAMRKDLRRARALAERDHREQEAFAQMFKNALMPRSRSAV
jgi:hypothetical protein